MGRGTRKFGITYTRPQQILGRLQDLEAHERFALLLYY